LESKIFDEQRDKDKVFLFNFWNQKRTNV
jgi:hypothetical protein